MLSPRKTTVSPSCRAKSAARAAAPKPARRITGRRRVVERIGASLEETVIGHVWYTRAGLRHCGECCPVLETVARRRGALPQLLAQGLVIELAQPLIELDVQALDAQLVLLLA